MFAKIVFATALVSSSIALAAKERETWMVATPLTCKIEMKAAGKDPKELKTGELDTHFIINDKYSYIQQNLRSEKGELIDIAYLAETKNLIRVQSKNDGTVLSSPDANLFHQGKTSDVIQITPKQITFGKQKSKSMYLIYRCPLTPVQWNRISKAQSETSGGAHLNAEKIDEVRAPISSRQAIKNELEGSGIIVKNRRLK